MSMSASAFREFIMTAARDAAEGKLEDKTRVSLYRLAMAISAEELYRIEEAAQGSVNPTTMVLLQQLAAICDDYQPGEQQPTLEEVAPEPNRIILAR